MIRSIALKPPEALDSMYEMTLAQIPPADMNFAILVLTVLVAHDRLFGNAIDSHILLQIVVWNMGRQREPIRRQARQYDINSIRRVCKGLIRLVEPAAVGRASTITLVHPSLAVFLGSDKLRASTRILAARYFLAEEHVRGDFADMALASLQQAFGPPLPNREERERYFRRASDELLRRWEPHMIAEPKLLFSCRLLVGLDEFEACRSYGDDAAPVGGDGNIEAAYDATYPPSSTERKAFGFLAAADRQLWKMARGFLAELDGDEALTTSMTIRYSDAFRLWKRSRFKCPPPVASNPERHQARSAEPLAGTVFLHCSRRDLMNRSKARKLLTDSREPETNWELLLFTVVTTHIHPQCKGQQGGCLMHRLIDKYTTAKKSTWRVWITPLQVATLRKNNTKATKHHKTNNPPKKDRKKPNGPSRLSSVITKIPGLLSFEPYRYSTPQKKHQNTTGVDDDLHVSLVDDGKSRSKTLYDPRARLEELLISKEAIERKRYNAGTVSPFA